MSNPIYDAQKDVIELREVQAADLDIFFAHQQDQEAVHMAAFTAKEPGDRAAKDTIREE